MIFLLPLMLLGASYGYFYGIKGDDQAAAVDIKDIKQYPMDSFTANLADMGQTRYIRTSITLEYLDKKAAEELDIKKHRLNDIIITSLREKTVSDLDSPEKTQKLKNELLSKINSELTKGKLTGLYFNEFIIQ
ncbi:flagellar FliL protein [Desulfonispora thiosulfatigenes DSM 11270]|uniref:Flagellar protein FliL n=2 Tax=Desulfonispora thiosulfatigenes TaxID=83661 RepID=A0A1W1UMS2_DESTI|nr:flagellar FliL protein [Desulfonispora thiosulfatigenes DSM 11270]